MAALAIIVVTGARSGWSCRRSRPIPEALHVSTGTFFSSVVDWINVNFFDTLEALKNAVLLNVLIPFKRLLGGLPWAGVTGLLAFAGWRLGGLRLGITAVLAFLIAATGQWEKAMITVYLCGISVVIAALIGIPIGIVSAERARLWRWVQAIIDTLQTLPSFVYLMPAVMLFRVGDFTAMIAVVAYAIAPAIRYTAHGLMQVDPALIEAGRAMGCTRVAAAHQDQAEAGAARDHARPQPDDHAGAVDAGHHRAGRHARPRPGGLHRADQGRHRPRHRRRPRGRLHRHHRRPADLGGRMGAARTGCSEGWGWAEV